MNTIIEAIKLMKDTKDEMFGEQISHIEHAMQSYVYAKQHYPQDIELTVAAFWHDIGHSYFIEDPPDLMIKDNVVLGVLDHDLHASNLLKNSLPPRCVEMIRNHTVAKRYCMDLDKLSTASLETFHQEGGPLTQEERVAFENHRFFMDCLVLRECDDAGKDPNFPYESHKGKDGILLDAIYDTLTLIR